MLRNLAAALLLLVLCAPALAGDWPHLRGPGQDGEAVTSTPLPLDNPGLEVSWKTPLGSGYSGIAVAGGRAVTMASDGKSDHVVALDAATGAVIWRYRIGDTYQGHDGSDDGPLSTPVIADGTVYGLGPHGKLFALSLENGSEVWSASLAEGFGAEAPTYGFATTPVVEGDILVVQTGGPEGQAISGLDRKTGKKIWSAGDGSVSYQSPVVLSLAGKRQLLAVTGKKLQGLEPATGKVLWIHDLPEDLDADSSQPSPAGKDRFVLTLGDQLASFQITRGEVGFQVEEKFRTGDLGDGLTAPVYHDGYLYGLRRNFLACVNAETGERAWKSRPPGGRGLLLVDGNLVIFGAKGTVVIAEASPQGYKEKTRLTVMERSGYTWPSFADGKVFIRNLDEIAGIAVVEGSRVAAAEVPLAEEAPETEFGAWVRQVEAAGDKKKMVEDLLAKHETFPIFEGDYVHFVYIGDAEDVAISGNMLESNTADPLQRIAGTDLYYRTYRLDMRGRWEYRFQVNFDEPILDPRNPNQVPARWDDTGFSEASLRGAGLPPFLAEPTGERGRTETLAFKSELLENERELTIYLPPGYDDGGGSYPLLVVHDGQDWLDKGLMVNALDNLAGDGVAPLVVAFVPRSERWWLEAGGSGSEKYAQALAQELVPLLEKRYRLVKKPDSRAVMGLAGFGMVSLYETLRYPEVFLKAALLSVSLDDEIAGPTLELIQEKKPAGQVLYMDWNRHENHSVERDYDVRRDSIRLTQRLLRKGYRSAGGEQRDGYGWGAWRARTDDILKALFPAE